jgi:hypothetical protein
VLQSIKPARESLVAQSICCVTALAKLSGDAVNAQGIGDENIDGA